MVNKFLSGAIIVLVSACGKTSSKAPTYSGGDPKKSREVVTIPVSLNAISLALTSNATAFTVNVTGCASGATAAANEATPTLSIYKADTLCVAALSSLTVNGTVFAGTNPFAVAYTSYAAGSTAVFTDATGTHKINVSVASQLSSPVASTDTIRYNFATTQSGDSKTVASEVLGEGHAVSVEGDLVPNYKIDKVNFLGLNASGGARFTFQMECLEAIKAGTAPSCSNLAFIDTSYVLVKDTYNGGPSATQLLAMFPGVSVLVNQVTLATTGNLGGFVTAQLDGPNQVALNPKMLLVLKNGNSFQYFSVTAQAL
ncbi:MAG: hypothetical protein H7249_19455 [Chitinophagaceae bacterium]|nr:hypothetical protein [Oligoflexus sp.]